MTWSGCGGGAQLGNHPLFLMASLIQVAYCSGWTPSYQLIIFRTAPFRHYGAVLLEIQHSTGIPVIRSSEGQNLYHHGLSLNHGHYQNCCQLYA